MRASKRTTLRFKRPVKSTDCTSVTNLRQRRYAPANVIGIAADIPSESCPYIIGIRTLMEQRYYRLCRQKGEKREGMEL